VFFYLIKGKNNQFFAVKTKLFLFFPFSEAGHVLKMFLFFEKFEPQRSYKQGSYKKNACTTDDTWVTSKISNGRTCREDISPDTTCGKRRSHEIVSV